MMTGNWGTAFLKGFIIPLGVVSIAYIASFAITFGVFMPVQRIALPDLANAASLLFLPHGVRVLTAWLYGWRALLLLAPSALLTHAYLFGSAGFTGSYFVAALFGVFCATFSFWLFSRFGMDFRVGHVRIASWREVLLAGSFASVINVAGSWHFFGFGLRTASAYFFGDLCGLLSAMLLLMMAFRLFRKARQR